MTKWNIAAFNSQPLTHLTLCNLQQTAPLKHQLEAMQGLRCIIGALLTMQNTAMAEQYKPK